MTTPVTLTRGQAGALALVLVVSLAAAALYVGAERPYGDRRLARLAVLDLSIATEEYASLETSRAVYSAELDERHAFVDLYLHSDSADRLPEVTAHTRRAWRAYLVADQAWRLYEAGEARPLVAEVYGAEELLEEIPELAVLRKNGEPQIDNEDLAFVRACFTVAAAERDAAAAALDAAE